MSLKYIIEGLCLLNMRIDTLIQQFFFFSILKLKRIEI